jgi:hypothetical protein
MNIKSFLNSFFSKKDQTIPEPTISEISEPETSLPGISCYCSTYGRPTYIIENCIQCFLEQDYAGPKELVILNDFDQQELIFEHPEVRIINHPSRITPLGRKFNYNIDLCKYDILATWEDDDVFLKNRLSYSYNHMRNGIFHTSSGFYEVAHKNIIAIDNIYHSTHMFTRQLFNQARYTEENDTCDLDLSIMSKFKTILGEENYTQHLKYEDLFYIYVWTGSMSYHGSGLGTSCKNISKMAEDIVSTHINSKHIDIGKIYLQPKLRYDFYSFLPKP